MKILNLYAGIGGNRNLWGDKHKVTAVENKPEIAKIYQDFFPKDKVIVADAHEYLLKHFDEYDFIWSSPPCPSHSRFRLSQPSRKYYKFPDMKLYEEIIFLRFFGKKQRWLIENVRSYYKPLIRPQEASRHYFWANFPIARKEFVSAKIRENDGYNRISKLYDINIDKYNVEDKRKLLRNCVNPKLGLHIFNCAFKEKQVNLLDLDGGRKNG